MDARSSLNRGCVSLRGSLLTAPMAATAPASSDYDDSNTEFGLLRAPLPYVSSKILLLRFLIVTG